VSEQKTGVGGQPGEAGNADPENKKEGKEMTANAVVNKKEGVKLTANAVGNKKEGGKVTANAVGNKKEGEDMTAENKKSISE
jgi:hypothetical protein